MLVIRKTIDCAVVGRCLWRMLLSTDRRRVVAISSIVAGNWRARSEPIDLLLSACQRSSRVVLVAVLYSPADAGTARGQHSPSTAVTASRDLSS